MDDGAAVGVAHCPVSIRNYADIEPWAAYEAMRSKAPLVWDELMNAWVVLGYDECSHVEINEGRFRNAYQDAPPVVVQIKGGGRNITMLSGDEHRRMRHFFMSLMTPALVEGYRRNQIAPVLELLIRRIVASGTGRTDLTAAFGDQIPARVIAALLGMPWQDDDLVAEILHLHEEMMEVIGLAFATEEIRERGLRISRDLNNLLLPYIRARREHPQDDFISRVWTQAPAEYRGDLVEEDAVAISRELFLGGADTTMHGIANVNYLILTNDRIRSAVEADRTKTIPIVVEESMRLYGSVMYRFRLANKDCVLGGVEVRKDQRLILLHSAANRDPAKFGCPHEADLARPRLADHLAFNKGPRSCVGISLARAEMRDALAAVLDHLPNVRLDPDAEPPRFKSLFMRSWRPINVTFDSPS